MDLYVIILRLVHLFANAFWAGTVFFFALFLLPRVKQAGPLGSQFMQRLTQPPLTETISIAAALAALSGILLYWRVSAGIQWAWVQTSTGFAFTISGLAGIGAAAIGILVSRPTASRMGSLGKQIAAAGGQASASQMADMQVLAARLERALHQTAYLLILSLAGMAVARYL